MNDFEKLIGLEAILARLHSHQTGYRNLLDIWVLKRLKRIFIKDTPITIHGAKYRILHYFNFSCIMYFPVRR